MCGLWAWFSTRCSLAEPWSTYDAAPEATAPAKKEKDGIDGILGERDTEPFDAEQGLLLLGQRVARFGEDADKVVLGQGRQFDADGEPALQFGHQVAGLVFMKGTGGNEKNVICSDVPVSRLDSRAFDDGQQVALNTLARHITVDCYFILDIVFHWIFTSANNSVRLYANTA